jgi:hypothetical protein
MKTPKEIAAGLSGLSDDQKRIFSNMLHAVIELDDAYSQMTDPSWSTVRQLNNLRAQIDCEFFDHDCDHERGQNND